MNATQKKYVERRLLTIASERKQRPWSGSDDVKALAGAKPKKPAAYVKQLEAWEKRVEAAQDKIEKENYAIDERARKIMDEIMLGDESRALALLVAFEATK